MEWDLKIRIANQKSPDFVMMKDRHSRIKKLISK